MFRSQRRDISLRESRPRTRRAARAVLHSNPAWQRIAMGGAVAGPQAKLRVGAAGDAYERESDRVADQVMRMSARDAASSTQAPAVQRFVSGGVEGVQRQAIEEEEEAPVQRQVEEEEEQPVQRQAEAEEEEEEEAVQAKHAARDAAIRPSAARQHATAMPISSRASGGTSASSVCIATAARRRPLLQ